MTVVGITVVLPLEQSARHKAKFPGLMISAMLFCGIVFGDNSPIPLDAPVPQLC